MIRIFGAPYTQLGYVFTHWSNGGNLDQTFATPVNDTVFTAFYSIPTLPYNIGPDTVICIFQQVNIDAGAGYSTYAWSDGTVGEFITLYSDSADTITYGVTVTDSTGAAGTDSITVIFDYCDAIPLNEISPVTVYPVPSGGEITIGKLTENYFLSVNDVTGKVIIMNEFVGAQQIKNIQLPPGVYSLTFTRANNEVIAHKKVVIIR